MKKKTVLTAEICSVLLILVVATFAFTIKEVRENPPFEADFPPSLYLEDTLWREAPTFGKLPDETDYVGKIERSLSPTEIPKENFATNAFPEGSKIYKSNLSETIYVEFEDSQGITRYASFKKTKENSPSVSEPNNNASSASSEGADGESSSENIFNAFYNNMLYEEDNYFICNFDFETAYAMCTQALTECSDACENGGEVDFSKYIEDENLIRYMNERLSRQKMYKVNATGLIEYVTYLVVQDKPNFMYLRIARANVDVNRNGNYSCTDFLVKNSNGRLVIAEWYDDDKDCFDYSARGRLDIKSAAENGKTYWDDFDSEALWKKIDSFQ